MYVHGQVIMNLLDACNAEKERCLSILFTLPAILVYEIMYTRCRVHLPHPHP